MTLKQEYDYVVIGAGAAGSIVAAKAAEAGNSVLLLEMGPPVQPEYAEVWDPRRWYEIIGDPVYRYDLQSWPQVNLDNRSLMLLQSHGTGGCQVHNAMVYVRGGRSTYDYWAGALGCAGWDYDSLAPHFEAIEDRMRIVTASVEDEFSQNVIAAAGRCGLPFNPDYNGASTEFGSVPFQFTIEETAGGLRRTTSFEKYIGDAPPANLTVATGRSVQRLVIEPGAPPAVVLNLPRAGGGLVTVRARKEVVLSAGAIMSPAILLRSGIGPADALGKLDFPVVADLSAVGANFHDDLGCGIPAICLTPPPPTPYGYLAAGCFATEDLSPPPSPAPHGAVNLELQISTSNLPGAPAIAPLPVNYCLIGVSAMHLASRGTVTLDPSDPFAAPIVDPKWLSAPGDAKRCAAALDLALKVAHDATLAKQMGWIPLMLGTPENWIATSGLTVQHYVGSCQMGTDPSSSVVGPDLKVHGVDGLRVIDASVAPTTVTGNTAGVSMVIGAKGAELLLLDA
jgi:choline dehydrogenase